MATLHSLSWPHTYDLMTQTAVQTASGAMQRSWSVNVTGQRCYVVTLNTVPERWAAKYTAGELLVMMTPEERSLRDRVCNLRIVPGEFDVIDVTPMLDVFGNTTMYEVIAEKV